MKTTRVSRQWREPQACDAYASAVSLHSHTLHSREFLDFIPRTARNVPYLDWAVNQYADRYRRAHSGELDFARGWWTPPLCVKRALEVEAAQIGTLGLRPMVSLSDHDNIAGAARLRLLTDLRRNPISIEWTVPFHETFFHLGVHNLMPGKEDELVAGMNAFTASPNANQLDELLEFLASNPSTLIVFNHPLWDEKNVGSARHTELAREFIRLHGDRIHGLELNGLRPWTENAAVSRLSSDTGIPLISGGDRHGAEPNANLNLTNASCFSEFVHEIRVDRRSRILFMPHYRESFRLRMIHNICDIVGDHPDHSLGWRLWSDRVFYRCEDDVERSLTTLWKGRGPGLVRQFISLMRFLENPTMKGALRIALAGREEWA